MSDIDTLNESLGQAQLRWAQEQANLDHVTPVPPDEQRKQCSRCGSADRLRHFWVITRVFGTWSDGAGLSVAHALCYECDHNYLAFGGGRR